MSDKAVLITGGAKRVGGALSLHFAKAGYDIALHYHTSEAEAQQVQKEVWALGKACEIFKQDLADIAALSILISKVHKIFPHCRTLINNASVFERREFLDTDEALFNRQFDTNLKAPFLLTQSFAKIIGAGSVLNILDTDIATTQPSHFAYLMSKKSLADFTRMAARALGPQIRVNGVAPGIMLPSGEHDDAYMQKLAATIPLKANPDVEAVCEGTRWLSEQPHLTGQILYIDGGKHLI